VTWLGLTPKDTFFFFYVFGVAAALPHHGGSFTSVGPSWARMPRVLAVSLPPEGALTPYSWSTATSQSGAITAARTATPGFRARRLHLHAVL